MTTLYHFSIHSEKLSNRILIVKYEDLVTKPKELALKIYNFMGTGHLVEVTI